MKRPPERWTGRMMLHPDPELEARLQEYARRQAVPQDLAGRVYQASVGLLPGRAAPPLRLPMARRVAPWARLALAASIALAAVAGLHVMAPGLRPARSLDLQIAQLEHAAARTSFLDDPSIVALEQLLVTQDMTFRDLAGDFENLAADLGM